MRRWVGDAIDRIPVSMPLHYVVHTESLRCNRSWSVYEPLTIGVGPR